jgi:glycosyltransferase involved in cell wall biosynthesis
MGTLVDVVIPCYNDSATIAFAVASVFQQPEAAQVFVVDDGSTDPATLAELKRLAADGVTVIRQENAGPGVARRTGLAAATAPYVFLLDADDELRPGALGVLTAHLEAHPELAAVWCDHERFGDMSGVLRFRRRLDPWLISYFNHMPAAHALLRREAALTVEPTPGWQQGFTYDDWELAMSFAERGLVGEGMPFPLYRYRLQSNRLGGDQFRDHAELYARLRTCHPSLFANRRRNWRRSSAPWVLKIGLPLVELLPISRLRKLLLAWDLNDFADGDLMVPVKRLASAAARPIRAGKRHLRKPRRMTL